MHKHVLPKDLFPSSDYVCIVSPDEDNVHIGNRHKNVYISMNYINFNFFLHSTLIFEINYVYIRLDDN